MVVKRLLFNVIKNVAFGNNVKYWIFINLYGCEIGDNTKIGAFVEIQKCVKIGKNCKISSHSFICTGVTIEDEVFVGHGVRFTNDKYPLAASNGKLLTDEDWKCMETIVKKGVSIGTGCVILPGLTIGEGSMIGAGSVVTHDVLPNTIVAGNPAKLISSNRGKRPLGFNNHV